MMANSGHCWVLDDLAIERIMKGRMSCFPPSPWPMMVLVGGPGATDRELVRGWELSMVQAFVGLDSGSG